MKTHVFRLTYGADLKRSLEEYIKMHHIDAGYVACCVGCVYETGLRLADGKTLFHDKNRYEIVSLIGTLSKDGVHLHISLSGEDGHTMGGHLMEGTLINTTAEIILHELDEFEFAGPEEPTIREEELEEPVKELTAEEEAEQRRLYEEEQELPGEDEDAPIQ